MMPQSFVLGVDHHNCPVDVREQLVRVDEGHMLNKLAEVGVTEAVCLSTCNRYEIYGLAPCHGVVPWHMENTLNQLVDLPPGMLAKHAYHKTGEEMVRHGFAVASSLESMVVGEPQILGQMKQAWERGRHQGTVSTFMDRYFTTAFRVGKRVRAETEIAKLPVSVASAAVRLAQDIHGDLSNTTVLLIGAGDMCLNAARHLKGAGVNHLMVTNRSADRAQSLAQEVGGNVLPFEDMVGNLARADVVITSTASADFVVDADMLKNALKTRRQKPIFVVDIAVPRDVDPLAHHVPNCFVYDIDQLGKMVDKAQSARQTQVARVQTIIDDEVLRFSDWSRTLDHVDTIKAMRAHFYALREDVLKRENMSPEEATRLLINKLLHTPTMALKNAPEGDKALLENAARLFRLDEKDIK